MKKYKIDIYIILPVATFLFGLTFRWIVQNFNIVNFLNSGFFIALVTFSVGFFAIYLYREQQKDYKKNAAELILQEIRYAEQQIRIAKKNEFAYYLADKLLPTNSWHKNIHLFVKGLKETEIDIISQFYSHSAYLDIIIGKISDKKNDILIPLNPPSGVGSQTIQGFELNANKILKEVSEKIDLIYNTPAVDKLRSIAEGKF